MVIPMAKLEKGKIESIEFGEIYNYPLLYYPRACAQRVMLSEGAL